MTTWAASLAQDQGERCIRLTKARPSTVERLRGAAALWQLPTEELERIAARRNEKHLNRIKEQARLAVRAARIHLRDTDPDFWSYAHLLTR